MTANQHSGLGKQLNKFDKALVTGAYFGFLPIVAPKITKHDIELTQDCGNHPYYDAAEKMAVMRTYMEQNFASLSHPIAFIYEKPAVRKKLGSFALHFIGSSSGIAEATLIRTALSILSEEGYKNLRVDINCIGDKESINAYERELLGYVRKSNINLPDELRRIIKENVFDIFKLNTPETILLSNTAPSSITFLSVQSRAYFKEVLEYIEALGIEFRLTPELVGDRNHSSHTIFAIKNTESEEDNTLAVGYRYSRLGRFLGLRKEIPMIGINIFHGPERNTKRQIYKNLPKPKFYLIQLGREAKIKTLSLIELLRQHHIPMHHFIGKDKITTQLSNAENLRVPYLIIIGQKEALDNTVTIRNVSTRAQDTVDISNLPYYLKHISL
ncbi:MAG: hypothetical protein COV96_02410 [Candidatus Zambryskibacteria bacterium CG11_big_fil_rev_8_21_14_0_20_42_18]|uniref:Histidyl-tRNA synthetase n=1 Tax=Candidatus Zambryskibacteria bacterium CG_4_9_14_3_um_filter_42_15 TaxID=1975112 RepID=A0A2M7WS87_9BACT|nr:MAG: hypothetical protein COV96_02410 [Candidatus Zambryskibacteria bacterium CG11_big_fil_rev_8_21_14_0_20_42_18]PJA32870.1 MAG: hypothetical protein CO185_01330 [Candidatus Zambryskibacteria bacterium CG_4_9_14_3_um_filter_42_15]